MKKISAVVATAMCVLVFLVFFFKADDEKNIISFKKITYSFTIKNLTNNFVDKVKFKAYAPSAKASYQECLSIKSNHEYLLKKDGLNNQILLFEINNLAPFSSKIIQIEADMKFFLKPCKEKLDKNFLSLKENNGFVSDEVKIVSGKFLESVDKPESVSNWIGENISRDIYTKDEKGALFALKHKKGDCTEFTNLFASILKGLGISYRKIAGYQAENLIVLKPSDYHNWLEFYEDSRWYLGDSYLGRLRLHNNNYLIMKIISTDNKNTEFDFDGFQLEAIEGIEAVMND